MLTINNIPKVELHIHLDGSINKKILKKLSNMSSKQVINNAVAPSKCIDLKDYLKRFNYINNYLQTKENLKLISYNLGKELLKENVIYTEIRFCPSLHLSNALTLDEVLSSVTQGLNDSKINYNLILCMMRHFTYEENVKIIDIAKKYLGNKVCAIDLAGDEANYKTKDFKDLFEYAKKLNVPFTIHAGEVDGKESINSALEFGTKRLGHGIRVVEDEELIKQVKDENILLEICPTSNVQTNAIDKYTNHPIKKLYDYKVKVSINTDNTLVSNITLNKEYKKLKKEFKFTIDDFYNMNKNAIEGSFLNKEEKEKLIKELDNGYHKKNR